MKKWFKYMVFLFFTIFKFSIIKILHWNNFFFNSYAFFAPNTEVTVEKNSKLKIGKKVRAFSGTRIRARKNSKLSIADNVSFNYGCMVTAHYDIKIGENTEFGPNVLIYDHDHDFRVTGGIKENKFQYDAVSIGKNCWIGANTVILRGTILGDGCIVGAGSVIKGEYEPNSIIIQKCDTVVKKY